MRKWIAFALLLVMTCLCRLAWQASKPTLKQVSGSIGQTTFDGIDESYRELGGCDITRWKYRRWFQNRDFVTRSGCIVAEQSHTKVRIRDARPYGESSVIWGADIGVVGDDSKTVIPKVTVWIEYNFLKGTVTLLKTGETLPLAADKFFVVYVNDQYVADRLVAHDIGKELLNVNPKLAECFANAERSFEQSADGSPY